MIFDTFQFKNLKLSNRLVRSAIHAADATDDGLATVESANILLAVADNGPGLIMTGHAFVSKDGKGNRKQLGVYSDVCIHGLTDVAKNIHQKTTSKIFLQLAHAGAQTSEGITGVTPIGPSEIKENSITLCRSMNEDDINRIILAFTQAARRAWEAGFDGIQIHAAHGYLLSEFLSPHFNQRGDQFGGSNLNRSRFLCLIVEQIRNFVSKNYPIIVKINSEDFWNDGLQVKDMIEIVGYLIKAGIDGIELSGGTKDSDPAIERKHDPQSVEEQFYYRDAARLLRSKYSIPLIAMGGIRELSVAESIIQNNEADWVSMGRPFVCEPHLVKRWQEGDTSRAKCTSCNACFRPLVVGKLLKCLKK
ncbi:MAG: NADH:flavin oxidoreductase [Candidatus Omnitrophica bacterium]|nr:NADH:flavin oxidoreductase [Candidatus Omnitrophota bacterium]